MSVCCFCLIVRVIHLLVFNAYLAWTAMCFEWTPSVFVPWTMDDKRKQTWNYLWYVTESSSFDLIPSVCRNICVATVTQLSFWQKNIMSSSIISHWQQLSNQKKTKQNKSQTVLESFSNVTHSLRTWACGCLLLIREQLQKLVFQLSHCSRNVFRSKKL